MSKKKKSAIDDEPVDEPLLETDPVVFLDDLQASDWDDIARLSLAMYQEGRFSDEGLPYHQVKFKCAVAGFNEWLACTELPFCVGDQPDKSIH